MKVCRETPNLVEIRQKYGAIQMNTCVCFFFCGGNTKSPHERCLRLYQAVRIAEDVQRSRERITMFCCTYVACVFFLSRNNLYFVEPESSLQCSRVHDSSLSYTPVPVSSSTQPHSNFNIGPPPHQRLGFPSDIFFQVFPTKHGVLFFPMCVRHGIGHYSKTYNADMGGRLLRRSWNTWREGWTIWGSNTDRGKRSFLRNFQTGTGATSLVFNVSRGIFPLV